MEKLEISEKLSWVFFFPSFWFYSTAGIENLDLKISEKSFWDFHDFWGSEFSTWPFSCPHWSNQTVGTCAWFHHKALWKLMKILVECWMRKLWKILWISFYKFTWNKTKLCDNTWSFKIGSVFNTSEWIKQITTNS